MEIAVIIYINSITLSLLAVVDFALESYHEVYAALFGLALLVGATLFLALLFTPKVLHTLQLGMHTTGMALCSTPDGESDSRSNR